MVDGGRIEGVDEVSTDLVQELERVLISNLWEGFLNLSDTHYKNLELQIIYLSRRWIQQDWVGRFGCPGLPCKARRLSWKWWQIVDNILSTRNRYESAKQS